MAKDLVKAVCILHNFLCTIKDAGYIPVGFADQAVNGGDVVDGFWRAEGDAQQLRQLANNQQRHAQHQATDVRNLLMNWVGRQGARDWQDALIARV